MISGDMVAALQEQMEQFGKIRSMTRGMLLKGPQHIIGVIECCECGNRERLRKHDGEYYCSECYRKGKYLGRAEDGTA